MNQIVMKTHNLKRTVLSALTVAAVTVGAIAAPSKPGIISYQQPDGSKIDVRIYGDENIHWYESSDGTILRAQRNGELTVADAAYKAALSQRRNAPRKATAYTTFPTHGVQKALVILVEYTDRSFTYGYDYFSSLLSEPGYSSYGASGSARDYFVENSCGEFIPEFDVFGPVKLSHDISYYGSDDDAQAYEMVTEACNALDADIDFSQYDCDKDGWVDNIYIFYAGYGEADGGGTNTVWPHSANVYNKGSRLFLDGVQIGQYACSNELIGSTTSPVGIGTFCHEFSHVLGLPDLYATNGNDIDTPYYWSLMEHGNYNNNGRTPCNLTAYERYFLGWASPIELSGSGTVQLPPIEKNLFYRVSVPGSPEEYFLLENRQLDNWDSSLPGHGMLIWHIDYDRTVWDNNAVNNDSERQRVDLIEADGKPAMASSSGDPFPGNKNVTSFSSFTPRNSQAMDIKLLDIKENDGYITFNVNESSTLPTSPTGLHADNIDDNNVTLAWNASESADSYLLSVVSHESGRVRALPEYTMLMVEGTEKLIEGLEPETEYVATLYPVKGISVGKPAADLTFTTAEAGISYYAPTALEATDINNDAFTARWEALPMAERYLLSVSTLKQGSADADILAFSSPFTLPEGWESNVTTTMSVSGYYGESAPSLRMSNNADMISSPEYENDINSFSLWVRGYKADSAAKLRIEAYAAGEWKEVATISEIDNTAGNVYSYTNLPTGTRAIRVSYMAGTSGSVCIDDLTVGFGNVMLPEYLLQDFDCGNTTEYRITGLEKSKDYYYSVVALAGDKESMRSNEIKVTTGTSSVDGINSDVQVEAVYSVTGLRLGKSLPSEPGLYIIKTNKGIIKINKI
jgi:M6 family metalloprotease-like protein